MVERVGPAEGTVLVHVTEPDVEVTVGVLTFLIEERTYAPLECQLRPGRYPLRMTRGDRVLHEERFTVHRGEEIIVTAWCRRNSCNVRPQMNVGKDSGSRCRSCRDKGNRDGREKQGRGKRPASQRPATTRERPATKATPPATKATRSAGLVADFRTHRFQPVGGSVVGLRKTRMSGDPTEFLFDDPDAAGVHLGKRDDFDSTDREGQVPAGQRDSIHPLDYEQRELTCKRSHHGPGRVDRHAAPNPSE